MVHASMKNLQFDRRLQSRHGWSDPGGFEKHLEELPDVADKGVVVDVADEASPAPSTSPEAPATAPGSGFPPSES